MIYLPLIITKSLSLNNSMGQYYGITNYTTKENISSYWKGEPWCNLYEVMHKYKWNCTDKIMSCSYADGYVFKYDKNDDSFDCINFHDVEEKNNEDENYEKENNEDEYRSYNFNSNREKEKNVDENTDNSLNINNHVPHWTNGKCDKCGFVFKIIEPSQKINTTYYKN